MVFMILHANVQGENLGEAVRLLRSIVGSTQSQPGCLVCQAGHDLDDENALILREEWRSQADLDRHLRTAEYRKIKAVMDLSSESPEIQFCTASKSVGFEYVEQILGK